MSQLPLAIITGGAHRLGEIFSRGAAESGFAVLIHYHRSLAAAQNLQQAFADRGCPAYVLGADLRAPDQIERLFDYASALPHPLKLLVNSASVMGGRDEQSGAPKDLDLALDLNLRAPYLCALRAAAFMQTGGCIINIADISPRKVWTSFPDHTVAKAGVEALTRVLAKQLAPAIRVNALAPGFVLRSDSISPEAWSALLDRVPMGRSAAAEEVAAAIRFLVENAYVTGQILTIDGGYSLVA